MTISIVRIPALGMFALVAATSGCAADGKVTKRIGMLEHQVADLQTSNRRLDSRMDELQIQLTVLSRKLRAESAGSTKVAMAPLRVVKLRPEPVKKNRPGKPISKEPLVLRGDMKEVDPDLVEETLPIDLHAARRPLSQPPRPEIENGDGVDQNTVARAFSQAAALFHHSRFQRAVNALTGFIRLHPEHPYAIEALFLVGRSRLALGDVEDAQTDFHALAQHHPKSERAAGALLLAGRCQEKLGHSRQARSTYLQVVESYPLSREATEANRRLSALR